MVLTQAITTARTTPRFVGVPLLGRSEGGSRNGQIEGRRHVRQARLTADEGLARAHLMNPTPARSAMIPPHIPPA